MKEKELRLTLVCYGGVSLAIYMHGVTREILKLVRASRLYHLDALRERRLSESYAELDDIPGRETDTEPVYFELLRQLGTNLDLRVVVDTIAGSSAGGINGVLLARALAHNLSIDTHRDMWLEGGDVTALMDEETKASRWSKIFMKPLFWDMNRRWLDKYAPDEESREKLDLFTRSRWFNPPFSGERMSNMLLDACLAMDEAPFPGASLLPLGQKLELIVSLTDFYGYQEKLALHDPAEVSEREHRHSLRFSYRRALDGTEESELNDEHVPGLVFAARATSCFPGAFPPAQIQEIDDVLKMRGTAWPKRDHFIARNFGAQMDCDIDPITAAFIDGSVVNNKPFAAAVASARGRFAYREVDRRIVYIDPDPKDSSPRNQPEPPGFFNSLRGALSDIPRNEPIREQLQAINALADRTHRYRQVVEASRPHIMKRVRAMLGDERRAALPTPQALQKWRDLANTRAARESGYAFEGYIQLKVLSVLENISDILAESAGVHGTPAKRRAIGDAVEQWAIGLNIFPVEWSEDSERTLAEFGAPWVQFLKRYDTAFRTRRLRFVIRRLNETYGLLEDTDPRSSNEALDRCKQALYETLAFLEGHLTPEILAEQIGEMATQACGGDQIDNELLSKTVEALATSFDLEEADHTIDVSVSRIANVDLPEHVRLELAHAYLGFPFFDVLTYPMLRWNQVDDVEELLVDRFSPEDAQTLRPGVGKGLLKGRMLDRFGAFFSRAARENDYLWGRLHGAERLVDLICSTGGICVGEADINPLSIKLRLFRAILEAEAPHLSTAKQLILELTEEIATLEKESPVS